MRYDNIFDYTYDDYYWLGDTLDASDVLDTNYLFTDEELITFFNNNGKRFIYAGTENDLNAFIEDVIIDDYDLSGNAVEVMEISEYNKRINDLRKRYRNARILELRMERDNPKNAEEVQQVHIPSERELREMKLKKERFYIKLMEASLAIITTDEVRAKGLPYSIKDSKLLCERSKADCNQADCVGRAINMNNKLNLNKKENNDVLNNEIVNELSININQQISSSQVVDGKLVYSDEFKEKLQKAVTDSIVSVFKDESKHKLSEFDEYFRKEFGDDFINNRPWMKKSESEKSKVEKIFESNFNPLLDKHLELIFEKFQETGKFESNNYIKSLLIDDISKYVYVFGTVLYELSKLKNYGGVTLLGNMASLLRAVNVNISFGSKNVLESDRMPSLNCGREFISKYIEISVKYNGTRVRIYETTASKHVALLGKVASGCYEFALLNPIDCALDMFTLAIMSLKQGSRVTDKERIAPQFINNKYKYSFRDDVFHDVSCMESVEYITYEKVHLLLKEMYYYLLVNEKALGLLDFSFIENK